MSDEHTGQTCTFMDFHQFVLQLGPIDRINGTKWLIQQHKRRLCSQCPGQPHTLLLSTGKLGRIPAAILLGIQIYQFQQFRYPVMYLCRIPTEDFRYHCNIFFYGHMWEQTDLLNNIANLSAQCHRIRLPYIFSEYSNFSGCRLIEAVHHLHQCGFPTAGCPQYGDHFLLLNLKTHMIHCRLHCTRKLFYHIQKFYCNAHPSFPPALLSQQIFLSSRTHVRLGA